MEEVEDYNRDIRIAKQPFIHVGEGTGYVLYSWSGLYRENETVNPRKR